MTMRRTALLGFGNVAANGHVPAWLARRDFQLVAVADPDPERRARARTLLPAAAVYDRAEALLARESIDAVDIAAPPALHGALVEAGAAAGCHVLCEKPLATSLDDYGAMLDAVRRAGVTLMTVHNWKYSAQFLRVAGLLAEGAIGALQRVRIDTVRNGRAAAVGADWRGKAELAGGGILVDHGWHALYLLLALVRARPQRIGATLERRRYTTADVEDTAACHIEFPAAQAEIHLTWAGKERRTRWQLDGTDGTLVVDEAELTLQRRGQSHRVAFARSLSDGSHHPDWFGAVIDGFAREIEDPAARGENLAEAETCMLLTALAYASSAQGGKPLPVPIAALAAGT